MKLDRKTKSQLKEIERKMLEKLLPDCTKGEWEAYITPGGMIAAVCETLPESKSHPIADMNVHRGGGAKEAAANAVLMAQAKHLYAALHNAVYEMCSMYSGADDCHCPHFNSEKLTCDAEPDTCFVQQWIKTLHTADGTLKPRKRRIN